MTSAPLNNSDHKWHFLRCRIALHCFRNIIWSIAVFKIHIGDCLEALLKLCHIQNSARRQPYFCTQIFGRKNLISFKRDSVVSILFAFHNNIRQLYDIFLRIGFRVRIPNNIFNMSVDVTAFSVKSLNSRLIFFKCSFFKNPFYEEFCRFGNEDSF